MCVCVCVCIQSFNDRTSVAARSSNTFSQVCFFKLPDINSNDFTVCLCECICSLCVCVCEVRKSASIPACSPFDQRASFSPPTACVSTI